MSLTQRARASPNLVAAAALAALLVVAGCAASRVTRREPADEQLATPGPALAVTRADDAAAARSLARLVEDHPEFGLRVIALDGPEVGMEWRGGKFVLRPRTTGLGGVNRIVVYQYYRVAAERYRGREGDVAAACDRVNRASDFLSARLAYRDGALVFVAIADLTFGNELKLWHLTRYLVELKRATLTVLARTVGRYLS